MHIKVQKLGSGVKISHTGRVFRNKMSGQGQSEATYSPENHEQVKGHPSAPLPRTRSLGGSLSVKKPKEKKYVSLNV